MENQTIINLILIAISGAAFYKAYFHSVDRSELSQTIVDLLCFLQKIISKNLKELDDEQSNKIFGSNKPSGKVDSGKSRIN